MRRGQFMEVEQHGEEGGARAVRVCDRQIVPTKVFLPLLDLLRELIKLLEDVGCSAGTFKKRLDRQIPGEHSKRMPRLLESAAIECHANEDVRLSGQTPKQNLPTGEEDDGNRCLLLSCQQS